MKTKIDGAEFERIESPFIDAERLARRAYDRRAWAVVGAGALLFAFGFVCAWLLSQ